MKASRDSVGGDPAPKTRGEVPGRYPSLDGLRAIAILLVLVGHLCGTRGFPLPREVALHWVDFANLGVRVFFVLSGFLITALLLREKSKTGSIRLGIFFGRRVMRLMPAYFTLLIVVGFGERRGWIEIPTRAMLHALTYTSNYAEMPWVLAHTWSVSVEEQFYLLWPAAILLLGVGRGAGVALAFICAAPFIRLVTLFVSGGQPDLWMSFQTVGDAIAVGCVLALFRGTAWRSRRYRALLEGPWIVLIPVAAVGAHSLGSFRLQQTVALAPELHALLGITVVNVCIAIGIDWCLRNPDGPIGRMLNAPVLVHLGVMSYSVYLWQQLFLNRTSTSIVTAFPQNILFVTAAASASYYLIERPALRLRERFLAVRRAAEVSTIALPPTQPAVAVAGVHTRTLQQKKAEAAVTRQMPAAESKV